MSDNYLVMLRKELGQYSSHLDPDNLLLVIELLSQYGRLTIERFPPHSVDHANHFLVNFIRKTGDGSHTCVGTSPFLTAAIEAVVRQFMDTLPPTFE
jgi:hypothetical protein